MKFIFLTITILFLSFCKENTKITGSNKEFAIVTASNLYSRKSPNLNSEILGKYPFGSPLEINTSDSYDDIVKGQKGKWIKEKQTNGYIFNKFVILTSGNSSKLKGKVDICNFVCGGGCFIPPGDIYLIGEYYIQLHDHMDYIPEETIPCSTIRIGKYNKIKDDYYFSLPIKYAGYSGIKDDCRINFIENLDKVAEERILKYLNEKFILNRMSDKKGTYFIINEKKIYDRSRYHEYCSEQSLHDQIVEIFDSYYIEEEIKEHSIFLNFKKKFDEKVSE
ncbi:SH3 domain-containing protein [Leptospira yanagawae]|uniref:SH3 domain-containing protein n=1 Tax=Leptospira yanagawae TaxID=293069 RepID=A0ABY2M5A1_9LEPT|nr:SH3 domain-containing protein [Leptospira yanagawae]TGL23148.1 SH3 domain-containing protein [Leptospira yanagawae]